MLKPCNYAAPSRSPLIVISALAVVPRLLTVTIAIIVIDQTDDVHDLYPVTIAMRCTISGFNLPMHLRVQASLFAAAETRHTCNGVCMCRTKHCFSFFRFGGAVEPRSFPGR